MKKIKLSNQSNKSNYQIVSSMNQMITTLTQKKSFITIDKYAIIPEYSYRNMNIAASLQHAYLILCTVQQFDLKIMVVSAVIMYYFFEKLVTHNMSYQWSFMLHTCLDFFKGCTPKSESIFGNCMPFKNDEKCFLFHLKSSFRSQDI